MTTRSNPEQAEFWNFGPGRNWVAFQDDLDAILNSVTDVLLSAAGPKGGQSVLDLGCGAGASTFAFARAVAPNGRVDGIDISVPLVERAKERQTSLGFDNAAFKVADAQDCAFERGAHDMAVSRFGLMFFSDPVAAFANIATALRPGGRLVFAAWAGPEHNPWFTVPHEAAVARLGPVDPVPPDAPGPMAFRDGERVLGLMTEAGFRNCACACADIHLHHPGGLDDVLRFVPHVGPIARMLREKNGTEEDRDAILEIVKAEFGRHESSDGIRVPARVNVFSAQVA